MAPNGKNFQTMYKVFGLFLKNIFSHRRILHILDRLVSRQCMQQAGRSSHVDNLTGLRQDWCCYKVPSHVEEMKWICVEPEQSSPTLVAGAVLQQG